MEQNKKIISLLLAILIVVLKFKTENWPVLKQWSKTENNNLPVVIFFNNVKIQNWRA
jgi:hypothetical protein